MTVLGIDTSGGRSGVTLRHGGEALSRLAGSTPDHSRRLLAMIVETLERAGVGFDAIERIGVAAGPGSFTGLRVGIATANGLARASGTPVVAVPTLLAVATAASGDGPVTVLLDARRGELFAARYRLTAGVAEELAGARTMSPAIALSEVVRSGDRVVGDGAQRYREALASCPDARRVTPPMPVSEAVARLAADAATVAASAAPLYLRDPHLR